MTTKKENIKNYYNNKRKIIGIEIKTNRLLNGLEWRLWEILYLESI